MESGQHEKKRTNGEITPESIWLGALSRKS
jgi:hypothetical protein